MSNEERMSGNENQTPPRPRRRGRRGGRRRRDRGPAPGGEGRPAPPAEGRTAPAADGPLVHVAFRGGRREAFRNPRGIVVRCGDFVMVEAERGQDLGRITVCAGPELRRRRRQPIRSLLRQATREEIARVRVLAQEDREAFAICRERVAHFQLDMKVIDAETQFDSNRITFYFTADQRVDFRELVRDLASIFRTRIELRQVGARDAARRVDGIGPCGRTLCCTSFLHEFDPVTLKMAKEQDLPLNPAKISGSCGRLMCCLNYEAGAYHVALGEAPRPGSRWRWRGTEYVVGRLDVGRYRLPLRDPDGERTTVALDEFRAEAEPVTSADAEGDGFAGKTPARRRAAPAEGGAARPEGTDESAG